MGEARGGDRRPVDAGRREHTQPLYRTDTATRGLPLPEVPEKTGSAGDAEEKGKAEHREKVAGSRREGRLDLNVPQVAGSAVAAVVAAKLASNLGVYGTIVGAGVVSVLGTCGGTILQHVFRRTGRHMQEVAVQARPGVRRVRGRGLPRTDAEPRPVRPEPLPETGPGGQDGYGEPTAYRARRRGGWKRPVVAVALAFGLTMAGITGYEAVAGENLSGHGHGTTIGDAVTGHSSSSSGGTDRTSVPGTTGTPSTGGTTGPHRSDPSGRPGPDTTPSAPQPTTTPSAGAATGGDPSGGTRPTPSATTPPPTSASPSPTATQGGETGDGGGNAGATGNGFLG